MAKEAEVGSSIGVGREGLAPIHSALRNVARNAGDNAAIPTGHMQIVGRAASDSHNNGAVRADAFFSVFADPFSPFLLGDAEDRVRPGGEIRSEGHGWLRISRT
jgi:hypothetical protein